MSNFWNLQNASRNCKNSLKKVILICAKPKISNHAFSQNLKSNVNELCYLAKVKDIRYRLYTFKVHDSTGNFLRELRKC